MHTDAGPASRPKTSANGYRDEESKRMALRRLTEFDLAEIRTDLAAGICQVVLAERYGVHQSTICRIGRRPDYGEHQRVTW